VDGDWDEVVTR